MKNYFVRDINYTLQIYKAQNFEQGIKKNVRFTISVERHH